MILHIYGHITFIHLEAATSILILGLAGSGKTKIIQDMVR